MKKRVPYGSFPSPIHTELFVKGARSFDQPVVFGDQIYYLESRPEDEGRSVIVSVDRAGRRRDVTGAPFTVRTHAHEYGGGAYAVGRDSVYFSHGRDNRIYELRHDASPLPLTREFNVYFADLLVDDAHARIIAVMEDHRGDREAVSSIVSIPLRGETRGIPEVLVSGADFYSSPRISSDGKKLAYLSWNHPMMPWDETTLTCAEIDDRGFVAVPRIVAGGAGESIFQPEFSPDGVLYFVSDRTNWWNLYRLEGDAVVAIAPHEAEFGLPQWVFGMSTYGFLSRDTLICTYSRANRSYLATVDLKTLAFMTQDVPYDVISNVAADAHHAVFLGGSTKKPTALVHFSSDTSTYVELATSTSLPFAEAHLSVPEAISYPTTNGHTAHAFYYPPTNAEYEGLRDERPPLLVISHGGPTSAATPKFKLAIQFFTNRGFAVLDVNYRGSTGYGRAYRDALLGVWGVADVEDCVYGARALVERGLVDGNRLIIRGGSAGGYTTLCALTFHDVFRAGASFYGISDAEALAQETHKFESRYMDRLMGPYPEMKSVYEARSPIHYAERLSAPTIFFQGTADKVVPANQAERMVNALKKNGIPVAFVLYEGEGHGFIRAENITHSLAAELYFYARIFNFPYRDEVPVLEIANLSD